MERLHSDIDALSTASTRVELVAATQKVLRTMAYYISQSEAAVLEYREGWRGDCTTALYSDAREDAQRRPAGEHGPRLPPGVTSAHTARRRDSHRRRAPPSG